MTVFLTTQYLEEADVLADRVGIIDRGKIVAEGTPDALKRDIGGDTVEAIPADPHDLERAAEVLAPLRRARRALAQGRRGAPAEGAEQLPDIVRALDDAGIALAHLQLHSPSLDDVFLAKTGRSLEGAGEEGEAADRGGRPGVIARARPARSASSRGARCGARCASPRSSCRRSSSRSSCWRSTRAGSSAATKIPGFPTDSYLDFAITVTFIQGAMFSSITAGTELATDIETGFLDRLQLTPLRRVTILVGQMAGRHDAGAASARWPTSRSACSSGVDIKSGPGGAVVLVALRGLHRAWPSPASARRWARAPARPRRCRAPSR